MTRHCTRVVSGETTPQVRAHVELVPAYRPAHGVLIKEWRLLQRAVFVVNRDGTIAYAEYVRDQMGEPDHHAATESASAAI